MAIAVELALEQVQSALDKEIASIKRAINTNTKPKMRVLFEQELAEFSAARANLKQIASK